MTDADDLRTRAADLQEILHQKLRLKGADLSVALRKGRRALPRAVRKDAQALVTALPMLGHPKLEQQIDFAAVRAAHGRVMTHLASIDVRELRKARWMDRAAIAGANFLVIVGLLIAWAVWSGQL